MSKDNKKKNEEGKKDNAVLIIAFLVILLGIALYFVFYDSVKIESTQSLKLTVQQDMTTADGQTRIVQATYNLDITKDNFSKSEVENTIRESMASFTYEEITGDDAVENLKDKVKYDLEGIVGVGNVGDVYITDFTTDALKNDYNASAQWEQRSNGIMNGLFENIGN